MLRYEGVPEDGVLEGLPSHMNYEEAAPICDGALTALNFLKNVANIQNGQSILIIGASGSIGTSAVQLAKHLGAKVTGVCSTTNLKLVKSLGADHVIDYTKDDFSKNQQSYGFIFDTIGKHSYSHCKNLLTPTGVYLSPVLGLRLLFQMLWTSKLNNKKAKFSATGLRPASELRILLKELKQIFEAGKIKTVIDKYYLLDQIVNAHRYVAAGHKKGNIVIMPGLC